AQKPPPHAEASVIWPIETGGHNMRIVIIDGQGGGIGRQLAELLKERGMADAITVVGTNAVATSNMMRAGIASGATGENAVAYNSRHADILAGPIGIMFPNAMLGEITPAMAAAIGESAAQKVLIPVSGMQSRHAHIVGLVHKPLTELLAEAADSIERLAASGTVG
ncbi:DUF3842 family protein, partial [Ruminococcaceae bacterium OttesenSCG-928-L11]|nr:DUF3842 family protein [Ruminococcaceae bacterium OttesenSCG-928-L11]